MDEVPPFQARVTIAKHIAHKTMQARLYIVGASRVKSNTFLTSTVMAEAGTAVYWGM